MPTSKAIANVTQSLLDDERTLLQESARVDAPRRAVLVRLANERRRFAEELERFNGQGSRESWGALARELGRDVRAHVNDKNDIAVAIASCRRSRDRTEEQYASALRLDLPSGVRAALTAQRKQLEAAEAELAGLES
jgi:hypothetical protein